MTYIISWTCTNMTSARVVGTFPRISSPNIQHTVNAYNTWRNPGNLCAWSIQTSPSPTPDMLMLRMKMHPGTYYSNINSIQALLLSIDEAEYTLSILGSELPNLLANYPIESWDMTASQIINALKDEIQGGNLVSNGHQKKYEKVE